MASGVSYSCINPKSGCSYTIESNVMMTGEMFLLRNDGTQVKL